MSEEYIEKINQSCRELIFSHIKGNRILDVQNYILRCSFDINLRDENSLTMLMVACLYGYYDMVDTLIKLKADVDLVDKNGNNALVWCIQNYDIVKLLVHAKINVNQQNFEFKTPLMFASQLGELNVVKLLLKHNANIHDIDSNGNNALLWSCAIMNNKQIIRYLIRNKINSTIRNKNGKSFNDLLKQFN